MMVRCMHEGTGRSANRLWTKATEQETLWRQLPHWRSCIGDRLGCTWVMAPKVRESTGLRYARTCTF